MLSTFDKIQEAVAFIRSRTDLAPRTGLILGTGLGAVADAVEPVAQIDYADIPHFPTSTVESHRGQLILGFLQKKPVAVLAGRFHYYEGWSMQQAVFPVRALKFLGVERMLITNVSGSTRAGAQAGDLVLVRDHINLLPENPLRGPNDERIGPRFPDMLGAYDRPMIEAARAIAAEEGIRASEGVYVALQGPNLETPAEYVFLNKIGGDCVGMSTVPEVLAARHAGMRVFVCSMISNASYPPDVIQPTTLETVIAAARAAEPKLRRLLERLIAETD